MRSFLSWLNDNVERVLLLWLYSYLVVVIFIEVLRRFVLAHSSLWGEETARFIFIYLVWIAAASAVRGRSHIRLDVVTLFLPVRGQALIYILGDLATGAIACVALYWSMAPVSISLRFGSVTEALQLSQALFLAAVPIGFLLVILRVVQSLVRDVRAFAAGEQPFTGTRLFE